jgi:hypothetical protein
MGEDREKTGRRQGSGEGEERGKVMGKEEFRVSKLCVLMVLVRVVAHCTHARWTARDRL